jgi:adenosine deaminase
MHFTIHAGEWAGPENIHDAVVNLQARRVGHGIRCVEDPALIELLRERQVVLEVCPTSNVHSGIVVDWPDHPLPKLFRQNLLTTINTDDPLVSNVTLSDEMTRAVQDMGLSLDELKQQVLTAAQASFLPDKERDALVAKFQAWLYP